MNPFAALFLLGVIGSIHCVAMCGALACSASFSPANSLRSSLARAAAFNVGRTISYGALGVMVGAWGLSLYSLLPSTGTERALRFTTGVAVVLFGISLAGNDFLSGGPIAWLWKQVEPRVVRLFPVSTMGGAFSLGLFWGLFPCGLLYAALLSAAGIASPVQSGLAMVAFGAGTFPAMLVSAIGFSAISHRTRSRWLRRIASGVVVASGAWICWMSLGTTTSHACCVASLAPM